MYYADKTSALREIFGAATVVARRDSIDVDGRTYPVVDDVIICLDPARWPASLRTRGARAVAVDATASFASDIQFTFGEEWTTFREILPEHKREFDEYFDLIDLGTLANKRVVDLGCGIGRWSSFVASCAREIVLVDFSDAIFVARENLRDRPNAIFVMADILDLPLASDSADLVFCIGVLHHLPAPALDVVVSLRRLAPELLIYLYYSLDNKPVHYRALLGLVTAVRERLAGVTGKQTRNWLTSALTLGVYVPMVALGHLVAPIGLGEKIPLYEGYRGKSIKRMRQDVYDRFFTRIEQRFSRREIETLSRHFSRVIVSPGVPYWHFLCRR